MRVLKQLFIFSIVAINALAASESALENELEGLLSKNTELKADVGSRSGSKDTLNSSTPIDVITYDQIEKSGLVSLTDVMRYFVAGFNAPEPSLNDGSDHVRSFTLRGMGSDQILVLVNGKRLHTSSLLNTNGTIGRGSSSVDLDTIAVSAIERIEILRDGAAAQYGSDAISGVINIILKGMGHSSSVSLSTGLRSRGDGRRLSSDGFVSVPLKYDGFANITISARDQEATNRAGIDARAGVVTHGVTTKFGTPDSRNYLAVLNVEAPQENDIVFYTNALFNKRESRANAFFRAPSASSLPLYPDGFLPKINATILDYSLVVGAQGSAGDLFQWDISNTYGYNSFDFHLDDTMNYTLGALSPTSFSNGSLGFAQDTVNIDLKKKIGNLNLAGGLEYRNEEYQIKAGDVSSYTGSGSQGFSGFRPENAVDATRNSYALYLDGKYDFGENISLNGAGRLESFSDFGQTQNFKLALGYKPIPELLLRTSASTGFRAPSLAQSSYSFVSSYLNGATLNTGGTLKPSDPISQSFGAQELRPETSTHYALGGVYKPNENSSLMIDFFDIEVDNKIMLSNSFATTLAQQAATGIYSVNFLTNAVNTRTQGVDVKFNHKTQFEDHTELNSGIWFNYSENKVIKYNNPSITMSNSFKEIAKLENGQPTSSLKILNTYTFKQLDTTLNINRFGAYKQAIGTTLYSFDPTWTVDLDLTYKISKTASLSIGGNNIFNAMPSKWDGLSGAGSVYGYAGIIPYSLYSPIGYGGSYYYSRVNIKF